MKAMWALLAALALPFAIQSYGQSVQQASSPLPCPSPATTATASEATATPEPTEDTEDLNDWRAISPDRDLLAVTRLIPDRFYIQRYDLDGVAVAIFPLGDQEHPVARHDFRGRIISHIEWSPDSRFLLFTMASSGGHSPSYAPAFLFCVADKSFRDVEPAIAGSIVSPKFRFEPPDVAILLVKKDEKPEVEVKVSLSKTIDHMPRVR